MKPSLKIKGLHVQIENKEILKGVDLVINGEKFMRSWAPTERENRH